MNKSKLQILSNAQQVFLENPFFSTNIEIVLDLLNITKTTFHSNFKSKNQLLLDLLNYEANQILDQLQNLLNQNTNPLNALNKFIDWRIENYKVTGRLINKIGNEIQNKNLASTKQIKKIYGDYLSYLIQMIEEGKRKGQLIDATPAKALANFILFGIEGGITPANLTNNLNQYVDHVEMIKRMVRSYRTIDFN